MEKLEQLQRYIDNKKLALAKLKSDYEKAKKSLDEEIARLCLDFSAEIRGLDSVKLAAGKSVIKVRADSKNLEGDDAATIRDFIDALLNNPEVLQEKYMATKNYAHWHHQGCVHSHYAGPKHGSVCFSLSLAESYRSKPIPYLSKEEMDAALYLLNSMLDKNSSDGL